ncbi:tumor necrosis factor receptor superfamily member 6-like isoform X1 [Carcharodon carcharias]|uniref:tumor necrosis factor receptor superfamily member 6-like isoform X1 n=1 Tax=Carcharodon carcharias TaxID=13397 RepID=UPI001B7E28EC|nr:tumor necrosis factor receptor superfamily member 6-like isoform X1 [Carcharodon carcharias]XP_041065541.1 tumor necrosis factor receptor superfamily member 6-like isoform X1 [Carcharodon carcharias]XP_041065543.1 tumor necrosis factor receptor superfamily member 6-like isoform X1 [Carcharodon carcharias]
MEDKEWDPKSVCDPTCGLRPWNVWVMAVIGAYPPTSVENNIVQNGLPLANMTGLAHRGSMMQRFRRQSKCLPNQYSPDDPSLSLCCDKCAAGTYLSADCTNDQGRKCEPCLHDTYTDAMHHLRNCHRCKQCQKESGEETKTSCTATHNTECTCTKDFFCPTPGCKRCQSCKVCNADTEEIAEPCTSTNDTVCVAKGNKLWIIGVVTPLVAIIVCGILFFKRKHLPCTKKPNGEENVPFKPINDNKQPQEVPDIELSEEHLYLIVTEIEPKKFHNIGIKLGLGEPKLQQIEADYHDDVNRQGYEILSSWLQGHGKKGAFPELIDTLKKAKYIVNAENIMKKIIPTVEIQLDIAN